MFQSSSSLGNELTYFGRNWWETSRSFILIGLVAFILAAASKRDEMLLLVGLGVVILWLVMVLYRQINKKHIVVYEQGIGYRTRIDEQTWTWDQFTHMDGTRRTQYVNGIPIAKWGANHFYTAAGKAFSVSASTASPDRVVHLMLSKLGQKYGALLLHDIQAGKQVTVNGFPFDGEGMLTNKGKILWSDMKQIEVRNNYLKLERHNDRQKINLGELNNGGAFAMLGIFDTMMHTENLKQIVDANISGKDYFAGIPKRVFKGMAIVIGLTALIIGGVIGVLFFQESQKQRNFEYLVSNYGTDVLDVCATTQRGRIDRGTTHKVFVVDMVNRQVYSDYQNALDPALVANTREEATLAICITPEYVRYETCEYGDEDASAPSFTIMRYLTEYNISVIDLEAESRVNNDALYGSDPEECPDTAKSSASDKYGSPPTPAEFAAWVEDYLRD